MIKLGIDLGTSTVKLVTIEDGKICGTWIAQHHGRIVQTLRDELQRMTAENALPDEISVCVTGANRCSVISI